MHTPLLQTPSPHEITLVNATKEKNFGNLDPHLQMVSDGTNNQAQELNLFRWKLGHQISTLLLQFAIRDAQIGSDSQERIPEYIKAHNALFQYTAGMDAQMYNDFLRPLMAQHDPSFSAHWWKEARTFRGVLQKNKIDVIKNEWKQFWRLHRQVQQKMGVEKSMRQNQGTKKENFDDVDPIFDNFFKIHRNPKAEQYLFQELQIRQKLLESDIDQNGIPSDEYFQRHTNEELIQIIQNSLSAAQESAEINIPQVTKVDHIAYQVEDLESTIAWYKGLFGARQNWRMDGGFSETTLSRLLGTQSLVELEIGDVRWHIFDRQDVQSPLITPTRHPEYQHFCIQVSSFEDLEHFRNKWLSMYKSNKTPYNKMGKDLCLLCSKIVKEDDGGGEFYCIDPNGVEIELRYMP